MGKGKGMVYISTADWRDVMQTINIDRLRRLIDIGSCHIATTTRN